MSVVVVLKNGTEIRIPADSADYSTHAVDYPGENYRQGLLVKKGETTVGKFDDKDVAGWYLDEGPHFA